MLLVFEYAPLGNLRDFLRGHRGCGSGLSPTSPSNAISRCGHPTTPGTDPSTTLNLEAAGARSNGGSATGPQQEVPQGGEGGTSPAAPAQEAPTTRVTSSPPSGLCSSSAEAGGQQNQQIGGSCCLTLSCLTDMAHTIARTLAELESFKVTYLQLCLQLRVKKLWTIFKSINSFKLPLIIFYLSFHSEQDCIEILSKI